MELNTNTAVEKPEKHRLGLAIASLVLGILSVGFFISVIVGSLLGLVGLVLGIVHLVKKRPYLRKMAWAGVCLSLAGIILSGLCGYFYFTWYKRMKIFMNLTGMTGKKELDRWVGVKAPELVITDIDGNVVKLSDLKGRRVILNFWSTWCGPCGKEIPNFIKLRKITKEDELVILGISSEDADTLRSFAEEKGINYPLVSLPKEKEEVLPAPFSEIKFVPTTFFIDRNGIIQNVLVGALSFRKLKRFAQASDYTGPIKVEPTKPVAIPELKKSPPQQRITLKKQWELVIPSSHSVVWIDRGNWNLDKETELLVVAKETATKKLNLYMINRYGKEICKFPLELESNIAYFGVGAIDNKPVLYGYKNEGREIFVCDSSGKKIWSYKTKARINGVEWCDIDADKNDEMIVGLELFAGLLAIDEKGKMIWRVKDVYNILPQAVIPAREGVSARIFTTPLYYPIVDVFDGTGKRKQTINLGIGDVNFWYLLADEIDREKTIQILTLSYVESTDTKKEKEKEKQSEAVYKTIAFTQNGEAVWQAVCKSEKKETKWRKRIFTCGDLNGDGIKEWIFPINENELIVVTPKGEQISNLIVGRLPDQIVTFPLSDGGELLIILQENNISAYSALG